VGGESESSSLAPRAVESPPGVDDGDIGPWWSSAVSGTPLSSSAAPRPLVCSDIRVSLSCTSLDCPSAVTQWRSGHAPGQTSGVILRRELPSDRPDVREVHARAFARPGEDVAPEAVLVDGLRDDGDVVPGLSIVAEVGDTVVGHVVCSRARIGDRASLGLGPLGVLPGHQRCGVGSALVHGVLAAADALGAGEVVLLGDPAYYSRFGFVLAAPLGITPPEPAWAPHFQVRALTARARASGPFRYAPAFERL
jgi:putative acetyltransferase